MSLPADGWARRRAALRKSASRLTPNVVVYYPFEVFAGFVGFVFGFPLLLGIVAPTSLLLLLPAFAYWLYAIALVLGSLIVGIGLRKRNPFALASGLQLLGGCYFVYGIAAAVVMGISVAFAGLSAFVSFGAICLIRATHFRRLIDIQQEVCSRESP